VSDHGAGSIAQTPGGAKACTIYRNVVGMTRRRHVVIGGSAWTARRARGIVRAMSRNLVELVRRRHETGGRL